MGGNSNFTLIAQQPLVARSAVAFSSHSVARGAVSARAHLAAVVAIETGKARQVAIVSIPTRLAKAASCKIK